MIGAEMPDGAPIPSAPGDADDARPRDRRLWLLESAERLAQLGSWEWLPESGGVNCSVNLLRVLGTEPDQLTPTPEFFLLSAHPDDRDRVEQHLESIRHAACPPSIEYRIRRPSGEVRHLRSTLTVVRSDDGVKRVIGAVQDLTGQILANQEIAAHVAVWQVLSGWETLEESGKQLLAGVAEALQFVHATLWLPEGVLLRARLHWSDPSADLSAFETATRALAFPRGVGFLGGVWERKAPVHVTDVLTEPNYRRRSPAAEAGLRGAAAFPAVYAGEVLAVFEFYMREPHHPSAGLSPTMMGIGAELGQFLSRHRGELLRSSPLTPREVEVLQLAADGCSRSQIADVLTISAATVASHMQHIFESLGVRDRAAAVATAIRLGLIE